MQIKKPYKIQVPSLEYSKNMHFSQRDAGFSLIEIVMVLSVIAIMVSVIVATTQARLDASRVYVTKERMQLIIDAIDLYVKNYGHVPCPAKPDAVIGDSNYGWATGSNTAGYTATAANCPMAVTLATLSANNDVVLGAVPVKSLANGLDPQIAVDGWGNRFSYIITEMYSKEQNYHTRTGDTTANTDRGVGYKICTTSSGTDCSAIATSSTYNMVGRTGSDIAYILISHGQDMHGAYRDKPRSGQSTTDRLTATSPSSFSTENMDNDAIFIQGLNSANYDDILIYKNRWQLPKYLNQ